MSDWTHSKLQRDLYEHVSARDRVVAATEVPLGPSSESPPRADVVRAFKSWVKPRITIYEVKARRQDLRKSLNSGKWTKYLEACYRFYFALAEGICDDWDEIPPQAGIMIRYRNRWRTVRKPKLTGKPQDFASARLAWALLLRNLHQQEEDAFLERAKRLEELRDNPQRIFDNPWRWKLGAEVSMAIEDGKQLRTEFDRLKELLEVTWDGGVYWQVKELLEGTQLASRFEARHAKTSLRQLRRHIEKLERMILPGVEEASVCAEQEVDWT